MILRRKYNGAQVTHRNYGFLKVFGLSGAVGERSDAQRSHTGRSGGVVRSENVGTSSVNCVRIIVPVNLRFPTEGQSAPGEPDLRRGGRAYLLDNGLIFLYCVKALSVG